MPLNYRIEREGEPLSLRWGGWHRQVLDETAEMQGGDMRTTGKHVVTEAITWEDLDDGEILPLLPGDVISCWWS